MNPLHSEYCCECPAGNSYAKLVETLNRVRILHVNHYGKCLECSIFVDDGINYPCPTIRTLEGEE